MTLEGTNTYVVGSAPAWVIDPGPDDPVHIAAVGDAAESRGGIAGVLLTHSHADHTAGVARLGAPVVWGSPGEGDEGSVFTGDRETSRPHSLGSDRAPAEGSEARVGPFTVVPTPGHAADHVCFVWERVCFCGDLVLGHGSSIVPPAAWGGSVSDYLDSLARVRALAPELLAPGHGPWVAEPLAKIDEYTDHRLSRERRLLAALEAGERSRARLLAAGWGDVPELMQPAAAVAMQAHLEKLEGEGRLPEGLED